MKTAEGFRVTEAWAVYVADSCVDSGRFLRQLTGVDTSYSKWEEGVWIYITFTEGKKIEKIMLVKSNPV